MRWLVLAAAAAVPAPARADLAVPSEPYVHASPDGAFYARCVPGGPAGKARTTVYRVGREKDEVLDTYDWFAPFGVALGWTPDGKVAVMARPGPAELSFHLGGKLLVAYTADDLRKLGVAVPGRVTPERADLRVVGFERVGDTNDRVFVVESGGRRLVFDARTGRPRLDPGAAEALLPARLNAALGGVRAGMTPDEVRGALAGAYPGLARADGPWSGQTGYVGFRLDERYSVLVAGQFDPQGRTVVSPGPRVSVVDQARRVRLDITPQPFGPPAEPK